MPAPTPTLLFCPFCRECFEGEAHCPEHDLALVPFDELPRPVRVHGDDEVLAPFEPRYGRALACVSAVAMLFGFMLPTFHYTQGDASVTASGLAMALGRAPGMWTVPFCAVVVLAILYRRRTLASLRGARLVALLVSFAAIGSVAYTAFRIYSVAAAARAHGLAAESSVSLGAFVVIASGILMAVASLRLGVAKHVEHAPAGSGPDFHHDD